ncbi:hypothetical protein [Bradyrhizobium neotropicale]|uniref:Uncharacterized protein n=1 Tax=Bradyrhizobium neotropicale TaxID=1497615 RepID=A0A176Z0Y0_9BRAD|nr:hypothetical protein [Bradyrhizobium neotropicale]OAF13929.1 hypothetical protein AXW67_18280 [Bradyrhizobium neotropicale]
MTAKPNPKRSSKTLADSLPALLDYQRDMHAAHRKMTRSVRQCLRQMEEQMAELRHGLDQHLAAQRDEAERAIVASQRHTPGVGQPHPKSADDRHIPSAQETPKLEIF